MVLLNHPFLIRCNMQLLGYPHDYGTPHVNHGQNPMDQWIPWKPCHQVQMANPPELVGARYIRCFAAREGDGIKSKFPQVDDDCVDILDCWGAMDGPRGSKDFGSFLGRFLIHWICKSWLPSGYLT